MSDLNLETDNTGSLTQIEAKNEIIQQPKQM